MKLVTWSNLASQTHPLVTSAPKSRDGRESFRWPNSGKKVNFLRQRGRRAEGPVGTL